jgi:hypothetical protein
LKASALRDVIVIVIVVVVVNVVGDGDGDVVDLARSS